MKPTKGRIVFWRGPVPLSTTGERSEIIGKEIEAAAIVTGVNHDGTVNLTVFVDGEVEAAEGPRQMILRVTNVPEQNPLRDGVSQNRWSWPPREP